MAVEIRMDEYDFRNYAGIALRTIIAELQESLKIYCLENTDTLVAAEVWQRLCLKARRLEQEVDPYEAEVGSIYTDYALDNSIIAAEVSRV
jgi:nucleoside diphosphate kinase